MGKEDDILEAAEEVYSFVICEAGAEGMDERFKAAGFWLTKKKFEKLKTLTSNVKRLAVTCSYLSEGKLNREPYLQDWLYEANPTETKIVRIVNDKFPITLGSLLEKRKLSEGSVIKHYSTTKLEEKFNLSETEKAVKYYYASTTKKENTMSTKAQQAIATSPKVTITYIYGKIAVDMTADQLQASLRQIQADEANLQQVADTKFGTEKLAELKDAATTVKALLDRHTTNDKFTA